MASKENENTEKKPKTCSRDNHMEACAEALGRIEDGSETWEELHAIKSRAPRATCIIPASSLVSRGQTLFRAGALSLSV